MHFRPQEIQSAPKFIQLEQGARNEPAIERPLTLVTKLKTIWWLREGAAEFFGTMMIIIFGVGSVAQVVLSDATKGDYQSISWGWGIGVMLGVYVSGGISGGHLNPAVTLTNVVYRKLPLKKLPVYMVAQTLGAFMGAAIIYGNYRSAIQAFEGGDMRTVGLKTSTAGLFCTYPAEFMTRTGMFFSEFIASAFLMFVIFAIGDPANNPAGDMGPLVLFFLIFGIGAGLGWETGYAINFARDFGPRMFTYMAGYGTGVFSAGGYYFWIPMVAPFLGCLAGGGLYDLFLFSGESPANSPYLGLRGERSNGQQDAERAHRVTSPVDRLRNDSEITRS
ncbi:aquaporin-like protein [Protomyces lactucae-debilis]|uniref:Aquaporin-like protein n=1 Tax=Protomyces lactucae-debilis TaxID=2754530 RepID=A0A1Y2FV22_PROLT|nr:aquaporin-like protein [Protomyces lactucae-debilis]ORY87026.1 aquaporin-like protein [Protomyces lactucae-debilis]